MGLTAVKQPEFSPGTVAQLEEMGFPTVRCHKALLATGNSDAEAAMNWLFSHMDDPGEPWTNTLPV
jgi:ubiquitin carboxyl-terminal hydrolase 5/13